jgi:hypothetical protein
MLIYDILFLRLVALNCIEYHLIASIYSEVVMGAMFNYSVINSTKFIV